MIISGAARELLAVDAARRERRGSVARLMPAAVGILNLFAGAAFEEPLRWDTTGRAHAAFLLLECAAYALLSISFFATRTSTVLARTVIFPLRPLDRYLAAFAADVRRREVLALVLSGIGVLAVVHARTPLTAIAAVALALEMFLAVALLLATASVLVFRTHAPAATALAVGGLLCVSGTLFLLRTEDILLPPAGWAASGILAFARGDISGGCAMAGLIAAVGVAAALLGGRRA
jgi:hypothetical protein